MQLHDSDDSGFTLRFAVAQIRNGVCTDMRQLLPTVVSGSREKRFLGYAALASAFADSGASEHALSLAERAFEIWQGEDGFIDKYLSLLKSNGDAVQIRRVGKRAGMLFGARGEVWNAIRYFNNAQYAEHDVGAGDRYQLDHDILRAIESLAGIDNGKLTRRLNPQRSTIRVAYLVHGATHTSSVLVRIALNFARHHDQQRFECAFFSPDPYTPPSLPQNSALFRSAGVELRTVNATDEQTCLFETASAIERFDPDLLVSFAAMADFRQYYLFAKSSATARISLCYGPPAQFVPPTADLAISATLHPAMDCPCNAKVIEIETRLPSRPELKRTSDSDPDALVLLAAGRIEKFMDRRFWEMVLSVLARFPKARFIAVGISSVPGFLNELLLSEPGQRVEVLGWLEDYLPHLAQADVVIDTFPSGGGLTILDAMGFGVPVLAFANDYFGSTFDQRNWNPAEEFLNEPSLIVPRGDFSAFASRLSELLQDPALRRRLGAACETHARRNHGDPERMVRRMETAYLAVLATTILLGDVSLRSVTPITFRARTDELGKYFVAALPAGEYDVVFSSGEASRIAHAGGRYEGHGAIAAQTDVSLSSATSCSFMVRTDEKGSYFVADLPAGEYDVAFFTGEIRHITHEGGRFEGQMTSGAQTGDGSSAANPGRQSKLHAMARIEVTL